MEYKKKSEKAEAQYWNTYKPDIPLSFMDGRLLVYQNNINILGEVWGLVKSTSIFSFCFYLFYR